MDDFANYLDNISRIDKHTSLMITATMDNPYNQSKDGRLIKDAVHKNCVLHLLSALRVCGMDKTVKAYEKVKREVGF